MNACLNCLSPSLIVLDSRKEPNGRRRRYQCKECGHRATSIESWVVDDPTSTMTNRALLAELATRLEVRL